MTIQEAIRSGREFRRKNQGNSRWRVIGRALQLRLHGGRWETEGLETTDDLLADDWETLP